jgi:hypothetical protein
MTHVAHRRFLAAAESKARRPLTAAQRLGPVGWTFAALAVTWAVIELWPLTQFSAFDSPDQDALLVVRTLGDAALLALPAGLLLGFPGARRRNRWLFRGLVLLALVQLAQPAMRALQGWVLEQVDLSAEGFDPLYAAMSMVSMAIGVVSLAAVWALSDGLFDSGARPRRALLVVIAGAAVALGLAVLVQVVADNGLGVFRDGALDIARFAISTAIYAGWFVVGTRLVAGFAARLAPRRAWVLGGLAGGLFLIDSVVTTLQLWAGPLGTTLLSLGPVLIVASSAVWVLLFFALASGLGRGTGRGAGVRRRLGRYEVHRPVAATPI